MAHYYKVFILYICVQLPAHSYTAKIFAPQNIFSTAVYSAGSALWLLMPSEESVDREEELFRICVCLYTLHVGRIMSMY
jgi:hypothetical protein